MNTAWNWFKNLSAFIVIAVILGATLVSCNAEAKEKPSPLKIDGPVADYSIKAKHIGMSLTAIKLIMRTTLR